MTRNPNNRYSSIDGFVPSNQGGYGGRHIGFDASRQGTGNSAADRIRLRRPGMRAAPVPAQNPLYPPRQAGPGLAKHQNSVPRAAYSEFTPYGSAGSLPAPAPLTSANTGRRRRGAMAGQPKKTSRLRRVSWKKVIKRTSLFMLLLVLLGGGWLGWKFLNTTSKVFGGGASALGFLNSTKLRGEDSGRVNILLGGVSEDDPGHQGASLTDSIMLVSLDTKNHKAMLFSIPRDLWVNIPGYGHAKINDANAYGDSDHFSEPGYPEGGMGLLEKTVSNTFNIPIHYYAKINYSAFRDAVNAVGGITVNIQSSDPRGLYDPNISKADDGPLKLPNGPQKLDGQTALNLARARGDPCGCGHVAYGFDKSDFTRTADQRMMLTALKSKLADGSVITNPLKIGELFDTVGKNLKTDLQPSEIRRLYDINKQIKSSDITSLSLNDVGGVNYLSNYNTADGASALIPAAGLDDFSDIDLMLKKQLTNDPVVKESAKIVVLNGGDVTGMASKESNNLTSKGLDVVAIGDAPRQEGGDVIIDNTKGAKPGTRARLQQIYKGTIKTGDTSYGYPSADFIVVLGTDHQPPKLSAGDN